MWALPQFGIFAQATNAHYFMEFDLRVGVTPADAVLGFGGLRTPEVSAGWREPRGRVRGGGVASGAPQDAPASLANFREITGPDGRHAPATLHDAWLWPSGGAPDVTWDHATREPDAIAVATGHYDAVALRGAGADHVRSC